jgi:hypothetical protein
MPALIYWDKRNLYYRFGIEARPGMKEYNSVSASLKIVSGALKDLNLSRTCSRDWHAQPHSEAECIHIHNGLDMKPYADL